MKAIGEFERGEWRFAFRKPCAIHVCLLLLCLAIESPAQSYKILHTFGTNVMGLYLYSTLVQGPDGMLYGAAEAGGVANRGQVFKVNPDGTGYAALKDFTGSDGAWPEAGLVLSGTVLYGTTYGGGPSDNGTVFKVNTDGSGFTVLKHFTGSDGSVPYAKLMLSGTVLYGTTPGGGAFGNGTVFRLNTDGSGYAVLRHFTGNNDGGWPYGGLVLSGSILYGAANGGGNYGNGVVFRIDTDGSGFAVLRHFSGGYDGAFPGAGLLLSGSSLYGTTCWGGMSGNGTVFRLNTDGSGFSVLKDFTYSVDGAAPSADLILSGTTLYGTTPYGGSSDNGTVFKLNIDGSGFTVLKDFTNSIEGVNCYAGLLLTDSTLYGSAYCGGANGYGSIFKLGIDGSNFLVLTNFAGSDGVNPVEGLLLSDTNFYGATRYGGVAGMGTLFRVNSDGSDYTILKSFTNSLEGINPKGGLVLSDAMLYGTAEGGSSGNGLIFKVNTDGTGYTVIKDFTNQFDGAYPNGSLCLSENVLYGTTTASGSNDYGTAFSLNTDGSGFAVLHSFSTVVWHGWPGTNADGAWPQPGLMLAGGMLYGTAAEGGTNGYGTVFRLSTDGTDFSVIKHFTGTDAGNPSGSLTLSNRTLYGATACGGGFWYGTVFKVNTDGSGFAVLKSFSGTDGQGPRGELAISGSALYGTTSSGGVLGCGNLFQVGTDGSDFTVLKHFTRSDGDNPNGGLVLDGATLYGTTTSDSAYDGGVLFSLSLLPGAPEIQLQPQSQTAHLHSSVSFVVVAGGIPTPSYQWFFNGNVLDGATNGLLELTNVDRAQVGGYWAVVTNSYGSVTSVIATLSVEDPFINSQPGSQFAQAAASVSFSVDAGGTAPLTFQWFKDGASLTDGGNVSGVQTTTLTLTNVSGADAGWFSVLVTNAYGSITSVPAMLVVQDPYIVGQPSDQFVNVGDAAQFSVDAAGTVPLGFQWLKDGASLSNGGNISGAQTAMLTLSNVAAADAAGYSVTVSNVYGSVGSTVAQLNVNYATADSFNPGADNGVRSLALQADGKILVGGAFTTFGSQVRPHIARLNPDGNLDTTFNPGVGDDVSCIAVQAEGKIVVGGWFSTLGGQSRDHLGRLNANGTLDTTFNASARSAVYCLALQPDGKLLVGGGFTTLDGQPHNYLGRLLGDGTLDTNFTCQADEAVNCLALQPDGKILVGGLFSVLGDQPRSRIARLNADGTLDTTFNPGASDGVACLLLQPDGKILVGGWFTTLGERACNRIGRLNADGTVDTTFWQSADNTVLCLALQADGKIVLGGSFTTIGGQSRSYLARLNANGTLDTSFNPQADSSVQSLAIQPDGKVLVGGWFNMLAGQSRHYLGRLINTDPATENLTFDGSTLTWLRGGSAPEVWRTTFEVSTNGTDWLTLGDGARIPGGWQVTGISASTNGTLRALGFVPGFGVSSWLVETMTGPPTITVQPQDLACPIGTIGAFCVQAGGTPPLCYQWFRNGVALSDGGNVYGAQTATLTLSNVFAADTGSYFVVVTNVYGAVTSQVATLTVKDPYIATQPVSQSANAGTSIQFSVVAGGTPPFGYRWLKNGTNLADGGNVSGAATPVVTLNNVLGGDAGGYFVVVTNGSGSVTSQVATLTIVGDPFISIQPVGQSVHAGQNALFMVGAAGTTPLSYQWLKNGINLNDGGNVSGAHAATLTLGNVSGADRGGYSAVISNGFGSAVSQSATLAVADPFISAQPASQTVSVWQTATLTVVAGGTGPFSYQWRKGGAALPGKAASSLVLANAQTSDSGNYDVLVSNAYGSITSSVAVLTVKARAAGDLDLSFDPGSSVNGGSVLSVAVQADSKVLLGGNFTTVHGAMRHGIARLNADGGTDPTFAADLGGMDSSVSVLAVQTDQKIIVGGWFSTINGVGRNGIVRLNPDGSLDVSFNPSLGGSWPYVQAVALQADGRIIIGGSFTSVNGVLRNRIARLNADGTLDASFLNGLDGLDNGVFAIVLQNDGKLVAGGSFMSANGLPRNRVARLNADGSIDGSFLNGLGGPDYLVRCLAIDPNGRVLIGGDFTNVNGVVRSKIGRLNADGSLDTTFAASVGYQQAEVDVIAVQSDQKILIGGYFQGPRRDFARLNADGSLDSSFLNGLDGPNAEVFAIALQSGGRILVGGGFDAVNGVGRPRIALMNADGAVDTSFVNGPVGPNSWVQSIALQQDGKVLIEGGFSSVSDVPCKRLARLNANGSVDASFLAGLSPVLYPTSMVLQNDGKILVGGYDAIARLNPDGSPDATFAASLNGNYLSCIALQPDGKILIGGQFVSVNGAVRTNLARLNPDGSLDQTFLNGLAGPSGWVSSIAVQSDAKILIGGDFATVNGVSNNRIARLNADGSLDETFTSGTDGRVSAIALQADAKILIGGGFQLVNGVGRHLVARINSDGSLDTSFRDIGYAVNYVYTLKVQTDGRILVGGGFTLFAAQTWYNLVRLNPDGSVDSSFAAQVNYNGNVDAIAIESDGAIFIGGWLNVVNGSPRSYVAKLIGDYEAPSILVPPQSQTVEVGGAPFLGVSAAGSPQLGYLWFFNTTNLLCGGPDSELQLTNAQYSQSGAYIVVVTNAAGAATSAPTMLQVIAPVERRPVPAIDLIGDAGSPVNLDYANSIGPAPNWLLLDTVSLSSTSQLYFDITAPMASERYYRAWQTGTPVLRPSLNLPGTVPAITLTGNIGDHLRVDYINQVGPIDEWVTLDTITLTNTSQLYFDMSMLGQQPRLYRIVPLP